MKTILKKIGSKIDKFFITFLSTFTSIKKYTLILESEGDFTDNIKAFYDYLIKNRINDYIKIIWFVHNPSEYPKINNVKFISRYKFINLQADFYIATSHIFVFSHPYWLTKWRKNQIVIHTTHSASQIKKDTSDPIKISDYVLVCSDDVKEKRKGAFLIPEENLLVIGQPRIDLLFRHKDCVKKLIPNYEGQKIILSMETFKQTKYWTDGDNVDPFAINVVHTLDDMKKLDTFLEKNNSVMLIKVHHLQDMSFLNVVNFRNIFYINDSDLRKINAQTNELLENADCLLTDYSSVFYEYLMLDRPIGFLLGDMDKYNRGFNMENPLDYMPGTKIYDIDQLFDFIVNMDNEKIKYEKERKKMCDLTFKYQDDKNSERLWNWIRINCLEEN
ncbi:MAG: CDP-glycerol glycerophosphotransferase family protein [Agathobacter sp.]|uniref:CDP-glycerol glycerophosphotransferase family protein n=1 Tax=Agathobacter sp. TaxID=2021311 RepID=UPI0039921504